MQQKGVPFPLMPVGPNGMPLYPYLMAPGMEGHRLGKQPMAPGPGPQPMKPPPVIPPSPSGSSGPSYQQLHANNGNPSAQPASNRSQPTTPRSVSGGKPSLPPPSGPSRGPHPPAPQAGPTGAQLRPPANSRGAAPPDPRSRTPSGTNTPLLMPILPPSARGAGGAGAAGGAASDFPPSTAELAPRAADETSNLKVAVRVRPLSDTERQRRDDIILEILSDRQSLQVISGQGVNRTTAASSLKSFTFHSCLPPDVHQDQVMSVCGVQQLLDASLQGYHSSILAYGQTGSGKTYTMSGREEVVADRGYRGDHPEDGLITRSIRHMFNQIRSRRSLETYSIRASYCEIYNELCYDLLTDVPNTPQAQHEGPRPLAVRWDAARGFYVPELRVVECRDEMDVFQVVSQGMRNRRVGSHDLNRESSRSHTIFTLHCESTPRSPDAPDAVTKLGKVSFVDLAGSERLKQSKSSGEMVKETSNINRSLFTLGKVISALSDQHRRGGASGTNGLTNVPYRESLLTKLLADSLGGSALTLMIACCSPSNQYLEETLSTLQYAVKAKAIQNRPTIQVDSQDAALAALKRELALLRTENAYLRNQTGGASGSGPSRTPKSGRNAGAAASEAMAPTAARGERGERGEAGLPPPLLAPPSPSLGAFGTGGLTPLSASFMFAAGGATTLADSLVASDLPSSRAQSKPLSAQTPPPGDAMSDLDIERMSRAELVARLKEAQTLLTIFFNENDELAREVDRLRGQRQLLALDHKGVMVENDRLQQKVAILERLLRGAGAVPPPTPPSHSYLDHVADTYTHNAPSQPPSGYSTPGRAAPPQGAALYGERSGASAAGGGGPAAARSQRGSASHPHGAGGGSGGYYSGGPSAEPSSSDVGHSGADRGYPAPILQQHSYRQNRQAQPQPQPQQEGPVPGWASAAPSVDSSLPGMPPAHQVSAADILARLHNDYPYLRVPSQSSSGGNPGPGPSSQPSVQQGSISKPSSSHSQQRQPWGDEGRAAPTEDRGGPPYPQQQRGAASPGPGPSSGSAVQPPSVITYASGAGDRMTTPTRAREGGARGPGTIVVSPNTTPSVKTMVISEAPSIKLPPSAVPISPGPGSGGSGSYAGRGARQKERDGDRFGGSGGGGSVISRAQQDKETGRISVNKDALRLLLGPD